jgi:hypothetical protein
LTVTSPESVLSGRTNDQLAGKDARQKKSVTGEQRLILLEKKY